MAICAICQDVLTGLGMKKIQMYDLVFVIPNFSNQAHSYYILIAHILG